MLDEEVALAAGLDGVVLRRLTTEDAEAFAAHIAGDLAQLGAYLPWPAMTPSPRARPAGSDPTSAPRTAGWWPRASGAGTP
jgi:hypothetical protein